MSWKLSVTPHFIICYWYVNSLKNTTNLVLKMNITLRKKCPYSEFFWSKFSRIWIAYEEILRIYLFPVRMWENTDDKNSKNGHFHAFLLSGDDLSVTFKEVLWNGASIISSRVTPDYVEKISTPSQRPLYIVLTY